MEAVNPHWNDILTVTGLNEAIRELLEDRFAFVRVRGEISDCHEPASGHVYFALIDGQSRVRCVVWRGTRKRLAQPAQNGLKVVVTGRLALYPPRGEYQLVVESMQGDGQGEARARLLALHARLAAEGLFAPERKRPVPFFPGAIGIVTSATGAALQDVIRILSDRGPGYHLILAPARVQGEGAAEEIVGALGRLIRDGRADVIICGRGGGSAEDLAVFNDERVVRAIAASPVPVISAVGHEIDLTLTDMVADLRAPTPSAAALLVIPEKAVLEERIRILSRGLRQGLLRLVTSRNERLDRLTSRLLHPRRRIEQYRFQCDALEERLRHAAGLLLQRRRPLLHGLRQRLDPWPWGRGLPPYRLRIEQARKRLAQELQRTIQRKADALTALDARLHGVSPLAILQRGYAIVYDETGKIRQRIGAIRPGDSVVIRLADGFLDATITQTRKHSS
ncbi:MAG: exodeoxyribonuclease VII large subunit [Magnetococcales bacterium]|nr:exodeoxyribonuclease VII large subunit [Magnetococcales bacterium]